MESAPAAVEPRVMDDAAVVADEEASSSSRSSSPRSESTPPSEHESEIEQQQEEEQARSANDTLPAAAAAAPANNELLMQLRAWKERSSRMEMLLAKKSAKIQELEETEAKLKRLLAMAKRSIDNSKHEIAEKDATIEQLREQSTRSNHSWRPDAETRDPKRILHKVAYGKTLWCLVEYANENDMDDTKDYAWHSFDSDEEIRAYANRASGEPIVLPELSLTPYESERAMSASAVARQAEQISETDVSNELQSARVQIRRLTKAQTETEERELEWRRKFEKLMKDYEKLSGTMGETVLATEWRERYEQVVREKNEMEKKMDDLRILANSHGSGNGFSNGSDLQLLRQEFAQYRKRALNAVEQKEKELNEMQAQYQQHDILGSSGPPSNRTASRNNGISTASLRRMSNESTSSLSGFDPPNATTTNEYLKNIVYKYMTSDQDEGKEHMETAIATVLNFSAAEVTAVQVYADWAPVKFVFVHWSAAFAKTTHANVHPPERCCVTIHARASTAHTTTHTELTHIQHLAMSAPAKDQRFQKVHNDPRFARNSKRKNKLQIDKRFAGVFKDKRFQSGQGKYDKYGRRIEKKSNDLKKFYRLEDEDAEDDEDAVEDDEEEKAQVKKSPTESSTTTSDDDTNGSKVAKNDEKLTRLEYLNLMARGELASDSDDSSDSDSDADSDDAAETAEPESEKEDVPMGEETKRFAVQNCDWMRIRAVDIFALCQSFAPATGAVRDVTIYPSDYGLQKMKEEEQHGPQGLWADDDKKKKKSNASEDAEENDEDDGDDAEKSASSENEDDEEADDDEEHDSDDPLGVKKSVSAEQDNGFDAEKLRKYELQKLKYYYAIVTCDSVKTASAIFDSCDQLEYETSSNVLDLRFVPDDIEFTNKPKDVCTSVPDTYKPSIFATTALQNTDVKLTWEEDDDNRLELLTRQADWKNVDDNDFSAYLASDNSSDEGEDSDGAADDGSDDEEDGKTTAQPDKKKEAKLKKLKNRYRKMLLGSDAEDESDADDNEDGSGSDADGDGDQEGEMEMTFTPGASDILKAKKQRELEENETPFERYAREKKQKKNQKLHEKRTKQKQLEREQKEVLKKKGKGGVNQVKLLREAIEDDDEDDDGEDGGDRNFDLKKIQLNEKVKKLKGKRKAKEMKKLEKKTGLQEGFEFDAADPRFSALYAKGSQFQLDPTDPKFKKTEANQKIFQERRKRNEKAGNSGTQPASAPASTKPSTMSSGDSKSELKAIVENLKRKSHQQKKSNISKKPKL